MKLLALISIVIGCFSIVSFSQVVVTKTVPSMISNQPVANGDGGDWESNTFSRYGTSNGIKCNSELGLSGYTCDSDLLMQGWGFSIASDATLISVNMTCYVWTDLSSAHDLGYRVWRNNLTAQASARQSTGQDWTTTAKNLPTRTYTPGSWTFSPSLTIADINSPSFGISVECDPTGTYPIYADCYVGSCSVSVSYMPAATTAPTTAGPTTVPPQTQQTTVANSETPASQIGSSEATSNSGAIAAGILIPLIILILCAVLVAFILFRRRRTAKQQPQQTVEVVVQGGSSPAPKHSTHYESSKAISSNSPTHSPGQTKPYETLPGASPSLTTSNKTSGGSFSSAASRDFFEIEYSEIEFQKELGRGAYGVVYLAAWRHQTVAVKKMLMQEEQDRIEFIREVNLMKALRPHLNVVTVLGVCTKDQLCTVTEFVPRGNMYEWLQTNTATNAQILSFALDICAGMGHLSKEGIVHRDLAARNLLLTDVLGIKITDFGLARVAGENEQKRTQQATGPLKWMATEALRHQSYSTKSDVWSFGITMIEIITRDAPYPDIQSFEVAVKVVKENYTHPIPANTPHGFGPILQSCWAYEASDRPSFAELWNRIKTVQES